MSLRILALLLAAGLAAPASAAPKRLRQGGAEGAPTTDEDSRPVGLLPPDTDLIDTPTAAVLDVGGFSSRTRFFNRGGVLEWLGFGVYPRVNLGASMHVDQLLGSGSPTQLTRPELQVKWRFFDGDRLIPAFAIGFDGQGTFYNRRVKRYNNKQRGLYVVGTQEIGLPGLQAHAGMNISDFDTDDVFGVMGLSLNLYDRAKLMLEWDNIQDFFESRMNMGMRFYISPMFHADFAVRAIGQGGTYSNGVPRGPERIAQFKFTGHF
ncbi:MAG: hypothetical protein HYZ75_17505 [Elusimicrobia bacterium]|nr:hypothetical protein [Elusimicrobiota bacterium]